MRHLTLSRRKPLWRTSILYEESATLAAMVSWEIWQLAPLAIKITLLGMISYCGVTRTQTP